MMKTIAVLLTVHNRKITTLQCLQNLYRQDIPSCVTIDIYLTDDGCTDGSREAIMEQFPQVHIVEGDGNLFWSRGMFHAWEEAAKGNYDFYLWLNDDTVLYPFAVNELLTESAKHSDKCLVVGACQSTDHTHMTYGGRDKKGLIPPDNRLRTVTLTNGNILLVPKAVFDALGNIDYHFHHGGGDFNYSWRAGKAGISCFQPVKYLGECDEHKKLSTWCDPDVPLCMRWKALYRPNAVCPPIYFYEQRIMHGLPTACYRWIVLHIRTIFPSLWTRMGKVG